MTPLLAWLGQVEVPGSLFLQFISDFNKVKL